MEYKPNKPGQPSPLFTLTPETYKKIVDQVAKDLSLSNAARIARVVPKTLCNWMERGLSDINENKESVFAQFFLDVKDAQGRKISMLLSKIEKGKRNWQALAWILEKCCAEDFGKDSEVYKQLLDDYKKLLEDMSSNKS